MIKRRNEILASAGFKTYKEYLRSDIWKNIRSRAIELLGDKCCFCQSKSDVVHHTSYEEGNLIKVDSKCIMKTLVPLCHDCHHNAHYRKNGKFMTIKDSNQKIRKKNKKAFNRIKRKRNRRNRRLAEMERDRRIHED